MPLIWSIQSTCSCFIECSPIRCSLLVIWAIDEWCHAVKSLIRNTDNLFQNWERSMWSDYTVFIKQSDQECKTNTKNKFQKVCKDLRIVFRNPKIKRKLKWRQLNEDKLTSSFWKTYHWDLLFFFNLFLWNLIIYHKDSLYIVHFLILFNIIYMLSFFLFFLFLFYSSFF